jgi:hypothetical protein
VAGLDVDDDYLDEKNWVKANPNLGVSVNIKELREAVNKAKGDPASLNGVLRLRLGIWTQSSVAYFPMDEWAKCNAAIDLESLKNQPCFGGLDLSTTTDIAAFVLLFPPWGDRTKWVVLPHFFLPEDNIEKRCKKDRVPYDVWKRQGLFNLTSGNVVDYDAKNSPRFTTSGRLLMTLGTLKRLRPGCRITDSSCLPCVKASHHSQVRLRELLSWCLHTNSIISITRYCVGWLATRSSTWTQPEA